VDSETTGPPRMVFRHSALGIMAALLFCVCALPLMLSVPWFWLILLLPLGYCAWLLWIRTTVDGDAVVVRTVRGSRRVPWEDVASLRLDDRSRVSAVLGDGSELRLPAVRLRDLSAVAVASGGRITDPATAD
jgi:hypothetical protein